MTRTRVLLFGLLLAFWLLLSGEWDPLFVGMGVISAAGVTWLTSDFVHRVVGPQPQALGRLPVQAWRFAAYSVWLLWRALVSSVEVAVVVVHPSVPVEPGFLTFSTGLRSPLARATLANSITLVPGTLTVRVRGDEFLIHALWPAAADDLRSASMQRRIAHVFLEDPDDPPATVWQPAGENP